MPHLLRELAPHVLGAVARRHGDFAGAEDAVQDALVAAARQWPAAGIPDNPRGWLYHVAIRRLADQARSDIARRRREAAVAEEQLASEPFAPPADSAIGAEEDDTLALLFMCCHPALSPASAIALTLRAVGGLTTAEIANAFLVPEATMAQRISRAKAGIRASGIPFRMPTDTGRTERLGSVLHVLYLVFSEGYASSTGDALQRTDLASEALRLTRMVRALVPASGEVAGLLALMLLTDARRDARTGPDGDLIPLDEQDRTQWNRGLIAEGIALVTEAFTLGPPGEYLLQASVAAVHAEAVCVEDTDWAQIVELYGVLKQMSNNPMVGLNHAVAVAMVRGPTAGFALIDSLDADARIAGHYRLDAVRGHLYAMAGDTRRAAAHLRAAAAATASTPERNYLIEKAMRLEVTRI